MLIDLHSHVLPGIDDGARCLEDARKTLRMARAQGFGAVVATPHLLPNAERGFRERVLASLRQLEPEAEQLGVRLYPGMECFYHSGLPAMLESGEALTLAGSRYALVEFEEQVSFRALCYGLSAVSECGCIPILAHYERYRCLMSRANLRALKQEGALLQMNFDTLQRRYGLFGHNPFLKHIRNGLVEFMGSDTHGTHFRPLRTGPSVAWLSSHGFLEAINRNAERVLRDEY
ncbi:MAG: CpsB/CapC family capsule biosynthesis tyrosine phosphatase [Candidatus Ventricola sp.]